MSGLGRFERFVSFKSFDRLVFVAQHRLLIVERLDGNVGKNDRKGGAAHAGGRCKNLRPVCAGDRAADGKPEAHARHVEFFLPAPEGIKEPLGIPLRQPRPVVGHAEDDGIAATHGAADDVRARGGVFHGVVKEVRKHPHHEHFVAIDERAVGFDLDRHDVMVEPVAQLRNADSEKLLGGNPVEVEFDINAA